jgi:3-oxoacyl-[acyl-carrier-protein] synthase II
MSHLGRVVISGVGILAANGKGRDEFWRTLLAGASGIGPITLFDADDLPCRVAGEVPDFNPCDHLDSTMRPKRMARSAQLAVVAAQEALQDARISPAELRSQETLPVVLGVCTSSMDVLGKSPSPFTSSASLPNAAASAIGYLYDIQAKLITVSNACVSGLDAIALASSMIRAGDADIVLAGGADASITRYVIETMLRCKKCSTMNDEPDRSSCPFDKRRDRGVMAEGAGIVVLENLDRARARGAAIYAEVLGYNGCADPLEGEEGTGMLRAMQGAMVNSATQAESIDFISAHGPSDSEMDIVETQMIKEVFQDRAYEVPISSIKGVTGCPMGAGGAHQVIAGALTLKHQMLPPTANLELPDEHCDLDYIPLTPRFADVSRMLINAHGIGRGNASMILKKAS